ncbi:pullulanase [Paenibacillus lemnae]|uniref:pullulanase n=1 Tax=Paenibacillus lemnae TaxID=1330551 RepID=A0A848MBN7_PAELE|nr:pullulanase [Paenibacillus lemnae]NMO97570.1 pullulanase [Paenibacillus lemnae]
MLTVTSKRACSIMLIFTLLLSLLGVQPVVSADSQSLQVTLVGDLQTALGGANNWTPADTATAMTHSNGDEYRFTGTLPAGTYQYKVALHLDWAENYGFSSYTNPAGVDSGGNIQIELDEETEVTFYYNHQTRKIADSTYYIPLEEDKLPRVIGSFQTGIGESENWSPAASGLIMSDIGLNSVYSVTTDVYAGEHEYQIALGGDVESEIYPSDGSKVPLQFTDDSRVTFKYNAVDHSVTADVRALPKPVEPGTPIPDGHLRVHYDRADDNYDDWGVWNFNDVVTPSVGWPGGATPFSEGGRDGYGAFVDIPLKDGAKNVGMVIVNRSTQVKDGNNKELIITSLAMNEVWLKEGSDKVHTFEPVDLPANTVRIHYQREDGNYAAYGLWVWGDVTAPSEGWPFGATVFPEGQVDSHGAYVDIALKPDAKEINFIVLDPSKGDGGKDGGNKKFALLDRYNHLFVKEADDKVFITPYGQLATGLEWADVVKPGKLLLGYTATDGLDASSLKENIKLKKKDGKEVGILKANVAGPRLVEVMAPFTMEDVPMEVSYFGTTVSANKGWRYLDELYAYDGDDLGAVYDNGEAELKLWAPTASLVKVNVYDKNNSSQLIGSVELAKGDKGVWSVRLTKGQFNVQDFKGYYYQYEVTNNGVTKKVLDPYAKSMAEFLVNTKGEAGPDGDTVGKAAIVDLSATDPEGFGYADIPGYEKREDAVIWEIHVRDFTSDPSIEGDLHNATWGSYDAFKHKLEYIKSLGVTHVQLLPVMAWYYGDESAMKNRETNYSAQDNEYNWGYDPHSYFSPDGAYSENPKDPELRIKELKAMIDAIHEADMGVILDVVYTHMAKSDFLNDIVPNYYAFQDMKTGGFLGDFGNNLATNRKMAEKLMVDSVKYWFDEYKIDGMRWDMMGDATQGAVQNAYNAAAAINPNALFIGEGWITFKGQDADPTLAGQGADQKWMDKTDDVGVFSDEFRNALKSGYGNEGAPSFITGGKQNIQKIFNNVKAQPDNIKEDDPGDVVQYIEAHDNLPLYDIIAQSIKKDPSKAENDQEIHKRIRLGNLMVLTSQGTAFLHAGQEYGRTKQWLAPGKPQQKFHELKDEAGNPFGYFVHDSYDSSDAINKFDWQKATNEQAYPENHITKEYTAGLIELRKSSDAFRLGDQEMVNSNVTLLSIPEVQSQDLVIAYKNKATDGTGSYYVFFNADKQSRTLTLTEDLTAGTVVVDNDEAGTTAVSAPSGFALTANSITLEPLTAVVIKTEGAAAQLTNLAVDKDSYSLPVGKTHQTAVYAVYDDNSRRTITKQAAYASSNKAVAKVSASGLVTGVSEGTAVITVTYQGLQKDITVTVTKADGKRYVQLSYIRPDKDYTDWNLWIWNTGLKDGGQQYDFDSFDNGVASILIEVSPSAKRLGFVLRQGPNWEKKNDYPNDRFIPLAPDEALTKVDVISMQRELDIVPSCTGPWLEDGNITFIYRDAELFRNNAMDTISGVKVKFEGREEVMTYDAEKEWYSYTWQDVEVGTYEYSFEVTRNGKTEEVPDPKNAMNGKSEVTYKQPEVTLTSSVNSGSVSYKESAILKVLTKVSEPVSFREGYLNLSQLGGPSNVKFDTELLEQSIAVKEGVSAGVKSIEITLVDEYGNKHKDSTEISVNAARPSSGKTDFDWDEARIYFVLTDRFMDGDETNNFNVDKNHLEAYHGGDFRGLIDKLDYIEDLGVNTLWITPIVDNIDHNKGADFNGTQYGYHGYWAKDFTKIDEHLGDLDTFKELIDKAHDRGIKIMVDVVLNHTGYGLKPGDTAPVAPEDKDRFAGMLRTDGLSTAQDDIQGEVAGLPDFITESPEVRQQVIDWQTEWLERARTDRGNTIDYFRVDTVKHVDEATWKAFKNDLTTINPEFKMIGEYFGATVDSDGGSLQSGQMDSLLDFGFKDSAKNFVNGSVVAAEQYLADRESKLDNTRMMGQFLSSHDENGFLSEYVGGDKGKLMAAAAMQITSKGQPVIYYGEELGRSGKTGGDLSEGQFNENRRDMPWDQVENEQKLLKHYQKLLQIRAQYSGVFSKGTRTSIAASDAQQYLAFDKQYQGKHLVTAIHVGTEAKTATFKVPFAAGSTVKDLYSGKSYAVSSNQNVSIVLPAMKDGGTVILDGVVSTGGGDPGGNPGGGYSGGTGGTPGSGNPAAEGTLVVNENSLKSGQNKVTIQLGAQDKEVLIPIGAGDILGSKPLELKKDGLAVELPAALLRSLSQLVTADQMKDAVISFMVEEVSSAAASSLVDKAGDAGKVSLKLGSSVYDLHLSVKLKDGTEVKSGPLAAPVTLTFESLEAINGKWAGVYFISDGADLEYLGGKLADGQMSAAVNHFSKYAVLEYNKSFADLAGHWAEGAVKELAAKHVINGISDIKFSPAQKLTRAQFATMLVRALGLNLETIKNSSTFKDVHERAWYAQAVNTAHHHGLVSGKGKDTFEPNAAITREEMALMLVRAYRMKDESAAAAKTLTMKDKNQISAWALKEVQTAVSLGLMKGHTNGNFAPKASTTRAESAQAVLNLLNQLP